MYQFLKSNHCPHQKKIILGYNPDSLDEESFIFSPIPLLHPKQINYEVGTEEGVLALLASFFAQNLFSDLSELDLGYLSAESNLSEEDLQELLQFINNQPFCFVITQDFLQHPHFSSLLAFIQILSSIAPCYFLDIAFKKDFSLPEYNGLITRLCQGKSKLIGSPQFATLAKIQNNDLLQIEFSSLSLQTNFVLDPFMRGTISMLYLPEKFDFYPYQRVAIKKIES